MGGVGVAELGAMSAALQGIPRAGEDARGLAERVCRAAVAGLDVDGASISLLTARVARETLFSSDPTADLLEELQFSLNEGACMEAATTGYPVFVPDILEGVEVTRWPFFAAAVAERSQVRALFALPLQWGTVNLGVLDLYRLTPGLLSPAQRLDALAAADLAALMMLTLRTEPGDTMGGDWQWLDVTAGSHAVIHQATGMVTVQLGVDPTEALARMRATAFVGQRMLSEVADDVVARRLVFTDNNGVVTDAG